MTNSSTSARRWVRRPLGLALAVAAVAGGGLPLAAGIARADTPVSSWSAYEATAPSGYQASDHAKFTVDSPTITPAMVGKTVVISVTGRTGVAVPDAGSLRLQWYDGSRWHQGTGVSAPIANGPTVGLKMAVTAAMVGQRAQLYGQISMPTPSAGTVTLTGRVVIGSGSWTTTTSYASPAATAPANDPNTFWASPNGTGDGTSQASPTSLEHAQQLARARMASATGDVHVVLADGDYRRATPVQLTSADSGTNGHKMVWTTLPGAHPVIDGAQRVTGWQPWSGRAGVYRAKASGAVGDGTPSIWVNGVRAGQTSAKATDVLGTIKLNGITGPSIADTGYSVTKDISGWPDLQHTSLRWYGNRDDQTEGVGWEGWVDRRAPIASATATSVIMGPDFINDYPGGTQGVARPTQIENNLALIGTPGQFYVDQSQGWVYYTPRSGENLSSADVELPVSQGLVRGEGVSNFEMDGAIEFTHDAFSTATNEGWADGQAAVTPSSAMMPGAVQFHDSDQVSLNGIQVDQTGAAGVKFYGGSDHDRVEGANIWQTGGSGVELGDVVSGTIADGMVVDHTRVVDAGRAYPSAPAVMAGYVQNTSITHDHILGAPYSGVSLGWGWGPEDHQMGGNHIDANQIEAMTDPNLFDGGDIYVNGGTMASSRSSISHNWLSSMGSDGAEADPGHRSWDNKAASYSSIYLDGSASHYDVVANVADHTHQGTWLGLQSVDGQVATDNVVTGNWSDTTETNAGVAGKNTVSGNQLGLTSMPQAALDVEKGV